MLDEQLVKKRVMTNAVDVYIMLALITLFFYLSIRIMSPFISVLLWAVILAVGLYPVFLMLKNKLGGKTGAAATIMAIAGLIILLGPAIFVVDSIIDSLGSLATMLENDEVLVPPPSESVKDWPLVGDWLFKTWSQASANLKQTAMHFGPQLKGLAGIMLGAGAGLAGGLLQFALSIIFAAVMLSYAAPLSGASYHLASRIASERGRTMVEMAGATVRNVSRGVLGVAIIQGGLAAVGLFAIGFPFAGIVAAITLASTIVQVPFLVIVPTIIYVWTAEPTIAALLYTLYMVPVLLCDNFLKPILMARGLETPMIVILIGVIGGTVTSGLLGLFIGPVILAVFYKMIVVWASSSDDGAGSEVAKETDETA